MQFSITVAALLVMIKLAHSDNLKTTAPVSIILDGLTLQKWNERSLWNQTRMSVVHHLNDFCRKDYLCDADYGTANVHLLDVVQYGPSSIQLNITADKPVLSMNTKLGSPLSLYNYTALLTGALSQTKIDIERSYEKQTFHSSVYVNPNSFVSRSTRLLFVFLGILIVAAIFGLTVLFFQRIRQHTYSKLLKTPRIYQSAHDEPLDSSPSTTVLHH